MSTFLGLIKEIPGISVDRFDGENLNSSAYFLSHCHWDHMHGLTQKFFDDLRCQKKYLYCSRISKIFLEAKHYNIGTCVKDIDTDQEVLIEYERKVYNRRFDSSINSTTKELLFVTCISAGHCPGSVMFLFKIMDRLVLYTGDFRINSRDYKKIAPLHYRRGFKVFPKKFVKVYLDTTFLDSDFASLPTREESIIVMCKVVNDWLNKSPRNVVVLECSATYGSEFLYMELSKSLNEHIHNYKEKPIRIHVNDSVYKSYCRIPDLECHITNKPFTTRIHACMKKQDRSGLKCRAEILEKNILTIVPSVLKWKGKDTSVVGEWDYTRERTFNVCYSAHASFDELEEFIRHFELEEIYPCVCPEGLEHKVRLLNEIKNKAKKEKKSDADEKYTLQVLKREVTNKSWTKYCLPNDNDDS